MAATAIRTEGKVMSTQKPQAPSRTSRRWRWLGALGAVVLMVGAVYGAYWAQVLRYDQSTDDAYVGGNVVQITPQISGTVVAIGADDTQFVKAGQPLVRLDPADAHVAPDRARRRAQRPCAPPAARRHRGHLGRGTAARRRCGEDRPGAAHCRRAAARGQPRACRWHDTRGSPAGA